MALLRLMASWKPWKRRAQKYVRARSKAEHVVIALALEDGGGGQCMFMQAGPYNHFGQVGLVHSTLLLMQESAQDG